MKLLDVAHELSCAPVLGAVQPSKRAVAILIEHPFAFGTFDLSEQPRSVPWRRDRLPVPSDTHGVAGLPFRPVELVPEEAHASIEFRVELVSGRRTLVTHIGGHRLSLRRGEGFDVGRAGYG